MQLYSLGLTLCMTVRKSLTGQDPDRIGLAYLTFL